MEHRNGFKEFKETTLSDLLTETTRDHIKRCHELMNSGDASEATQRSIRIFSESVIATLTKQLSK